MEFITPLYMGTTLKQYITYLKPELTKMGYREISFTGFMGGRSGIVTNLGGSPGCVSDVYPKARHSVSRFFVDTKNAKLFLALAGMTDCPTGNYGEWWTFTGGIGSDQFVRGRCYKQVKLDITSKSAFEYSPGVSNGYEGQNHKFFRKSTKEELVAQFLHGRVIDEDVYIISRNELSKIHDVACSEWKQKIRSFGEQFGDPFGTDVSLPDSIIEEMYEAASLTQKEVLDSVFPDFKPDNNLISYSLSGPRDLEDIRAQFRMLSEALTGDSTMIQLGEQAALETSNPRLAQRSIWVDGEVVVHPCRGKGCIIELRKIVE